MPDPSTHASAEAIWGKGGGFPSAQSLQWLDGGLIVTYS